MGRLPKKDSISKNFYKPLERTERIIFWLFICGGGLSITLLFMPVSELKVCLQILFLICSLALFFLNCLIRLYLFPRAEERRVLDYISSASGMKLINDTTKNYYNNNEVKIERRFAQQLLEDLFHTAFVVSEMVKSTRLVVGLYIVIWFSIALFFRSNEIVLLAAGLLFSEEVVSKYLRLEWLRHRTNNLYDDTFRMFNAAANSNGFEIQILEKFTIYEKIKATAAVLLSSRIFNKHREYLAAEWKKISEQLEKV